MLTSTIRIKNASFFYGKKCIFSCINLTLSPGKWVGLLGQSGVGKTSLLRMIAGLVEIKTGEIEIDNSLPANQQIAYMGQTDLLLPWQTTLENATLGLKLRKKKQANPFMMEQAISLFDASIVAFNFSSGYSREKYTLEVRPSVSPPYFDSLLSGTQYIDHTEMLKQIKSCREYFINLPEVLRPTYERYISSIERLYCNHSKVCSRIVGDHHSEPAKIRDHYMTRTLKYAGALDSKD